MLTGLAPGTIRGTGAPVSARPWKGNNAMPAQTSSPPETVPLPFNGPARSPPGAAGLHRPVLRAPVTPVLRSRITQLRRAIGRRAPGRARPAASGARPEGPWPC
jgi:hypothetical protein